MGAILVYSTRQDNTDNVLEKEFKSNLKKAGKVVIFDKKYKYTPSVEYVNYLKKHKLEGKWAKLAEKQLE
jgi:hypothetical protein